MQGTKVDLMKVGIELIQYASRKSGRHITVLTPRLTVVDIGCGLILARLAVKL